MVVYTDKMLRTKIDDVSSEETAYAVPVLKAYTVLNIKQIEGLREFSMRQPRRASIPFNALLALVRSSPRSSPTCAIVAR
ncbi:hypothetical protein [Bradyrhizobium stylosanthis]|uniref:hypothetical protein n=1 Tax=Bradyrhizobium stylosanthis TaxID=1803665 RepID=UPI0007C58F75|nr:hypothetical protein [Bradyrhizobium stylosanthis]